MSSYVSRVTSNAYRMFRRGKFRKKRQNFWREKLGL